jgi:FkbM family methyltransferase
MTNDTETIDDLLHGELKLVQPKKGFRYSVDALLLSSFSLDMTVGKSVLDMGCGVGTIALILAQRGNPKKVVGVEIQKELAEMAKRNANNNDTNPKVEIHQADATDLVETFPPGSFNVIVTNPPFRAANSGRQSPNPQKAIARHEIKMDLPKWFRSTEKLLTDNGHLCLIYPTDLEDKLNKHLASANFNTARKQYATDIPSGEKKLVLLDLTKATQKIIKLPDIPITTDLGKFSLDGYK